MYRRRLEEYMEEVVARIQQISKEGLLRYNGIDCNKYNSDKVYALINRNNITYTKINKEQMTK